MQGLTKIQKTISIFLQLISASILFMASYGKFNNFEMTIEVFKALGIQETRLIIATIEGLSALFLISKNLPHFGATLGFGTMLGALIAHLSVLGFNVNNDGGMMVMLMSTVIISTLLIMWIHRKKLPLIGHTYG